MIGGGRLKIWGRLMRAKAMKLDLLSGRTTEKKKKKKKRNKIIMWKKMKRKTR